MFDMFRRVIVGLQPIKLVGRPAALARASDRLRLLARSQPLAR